MKNQKREENENLTRSILEINLIRKGQKVTQNLAQEEAVKHTKPNRIKVSSQARIYYQKLRGVFERLIATGTSNRLQVFLD